MTPDYNDVTYEVLHTTNELVMAYVKTSDAKHLLKALELQADGLRILQNLLMNIEEAKPCRN